MATKKEYREVDPGKKTIKTLITRAAMFCLGMGIQTAYKLEPEVKKEVDSWPDTFTFLLGIIDGPTMLIQKRAGSLAYLGEKETFRCDVELWFKNIEYGYLAMTGRISTPDATYHNRQFTKGEIGYTMSIVNVLGIAQTLLFPNFIVKFYIKKVPKLTLKKIFNRVLTYINVSSGFIK
jgi:hypothetical protein